MQQKSYFREYDKGDAEDHACMYTTRKAPEDSSNGMDHFPQREVYSSTQSHNVAQLSHFVVGPEHREVETSQDGNTVNSKVGG